MSALVRAELLKLRTVALPAWLLVTTLAFVLLSVLATVLTAGMEGAPLQRDDPQLLARAVASASAGNTVLLVLGILVLTQEFRFGTATPSFLVSPRRWRVLAAKLAAVSLAGLLIAVLSSLFAVGASWALIAARGDALVFDRTVVEVMLGVGVGALIRNQIAAVVVALAWTFLVEQLLVALLPEIGRWTPGGAASAVLQLGDVATTRGDLLPVWGGAVLLVVYALVLSGVGARLTLRRDLT